MNKGLSAISNQLGRRLGYGVTSGSTFSSSASLDPGDAASATNIVTDDGTFFITDDGTEIITS
jgi:hypothetical protein